MKKQKQKDNKDNKEKQILKGCIETKQDRETEDTKE
jgi:hypothetical protein